MTTVLPAWVLVSLHTRMAGLQNGRGSSNKIAMRPSSPPNTSKGRVKPNIAADVLQAPLFTAATGVGYNQWKEHTNKKLSIDREAGCKEFDESDALRDVQTKNPSCPHSLVDIQCTFIAQHFATRTRCDTSCFSMFSVSKKTAVLAVVLAICLSLVLCASATSTTDKLKANAKVSNCASASMPAV